MTSYSERSRLIQLRFIDAHLECRGEISRKIMMQTFGVSESQATKLLREYKKNVEYHCLRLSDCGKKYLRTDSWQRCFLTETQAESDQYILTIQQMYS
jgi:hypothetical protein